MKNVREYVFKAGMEPTRPEGKYPSFGRNGRTEREAFQREDGRWVVRWTFVPAEDSA